MATAERDVQKKVRLLIAKSGGMSWRNNVGATPARCPHCDGKLRHIRYGLANDSHKLNAVFKSSDLIAAVPFKIQQKHVGRIIAQFAAIEIKKEGWVYSGTSSEKAQLNWLKLIARLGGLATFSTGN